MKSLDRAGVIRESVSVLIHGVVGLVPVIGIIPAVSAIIHGIKISRAYPDPNPVDRYRRWGMALGCLSVLVNGCAVLILIANSDAVVHEMLHWNG